MTPEELRVFVLALTPIFETRVSIPYGIVIANLPILEVVVISVTGNLIPLPFLLWGLSSLERWAFKKRGGWLRRIVLSIYMKLVFRVRRRGEKYIKKYGVLGLAIFVAIPLPGSGVWSGSLLAHILGLDTKRALIAITAGALIAAFLILAGTLGIITFLI